MTPKQQTILDQAFEVLTQIEPAEVHAFEARVDKARRIKNRVCIVCAKPFKAHDRRHTICGATCRQSESRRNRKAKAKREK